MPLLIPASEVAVNDYSPENGTVRQVLKSKGRVTITYANGTEQPLSDDDEIYIEQGGRF